MLALAGCGKPPATERQPGDPGRVSIGLSYVPNIQFAPFYVAESKQFFRNVPGQFSLRHHGANEALFDSLSAGREHFLVAGGDEAMQARAAGTDTVAVAAFYKSFPARILVLGSSSITKLEDLVGRSIGVPGRFGESWLGLLVALQSAGIEVDDVDIVEVGYTQVAALITGKVDAIVGFSTNELVQLRAADPAVRSIPVAIGTVPLVSTCLLSTPDFVAKYPETVGAAVKAMTQGIEFAAANPKETLELSRAFIPGLDEQTRQDSSSVLEAAIDLMQLEGGRFNPRLDEKQWAEMSSFFVRNGITAKAVEPDTMMTNRFAG